MSKFIDLQARKARNDARFEAQLLGIYRRADEAGKQRIFRFIELLAAGNQRRLTVEEIAELEALSGRPYLAPILPEDGQLADVIPLANRPAEDC